MSLYQSIAKPLLFSLDAERAHDFTFAVLQAMPWLAIAAAARQNPALQTQAFGLTFRNPVGLAAGLDKNARLLPVWHRLGFGFVEVGTVTPRPQPGNAKPRLFRLPADYALLNRMGFNNDGVEALARKLEAWHQHAEGGMIVGANIGKNKDTPNEQAAADYLACLRRLHALAHYFVVNVSSPNTPGLRALQDKEPLTRILSEVQNANHALGNPKPVLLKIAPDLTEGQLHDVVEVVRATGIAGVVATNTTLSREGLATPAAQLDACGAGGISGAPLTQRSRAMVGLLHAQGIAVVGVGGIMRGQDAVAMLQAGASLVQVYSGFIYRGPKLLKEILLNLSNRS
jgi:dihydroorotate dehydrogenase